MLLPATYVCPYCAQSIETAVDPSQGKRQTYVEDCQVCCRPLVLNVGVADHEAWVEAAPETD